MKVHSALAAAMVIVFAVALAVALILASANGNLTVETLTLVVAFTAFMLVGALIVARRPDNRIGWVFSAIGLLAATGAFAMEYAEYAFLTRPEALPLGSAAAWYASWYWWPLMTLTLLFTTLLFPTGRPLSRRWRVVVWIAAVATGAITILSAFDPMLQLQDEDYALSNPIGIEAVGDVEESAVGAVLFGVVFACLFAALASLIVRFRRSRGDERQQLKWFTYGGALVILVPFAEDLLPSFELGDVFFGLIVALPPVTAGIAILKYRLYDIDVIVNRTLVYGALTAFLGLAYFLLVAILQSFAPVGGDSDLAIVASTLAVAALFRPLRARIQGFIDRRFYRSRYDAAKTLEAFGTRLRDEVELATLREDVLGVVRETVQPAHASLWLRASEAGR